MLKYIGKRLVQFIPVFIGVTILLFLMRSFVPGGSLNLIAGERSIPPQVLAQLQKAYHLDQPIYKQYLIYLNDLLHGNLGQSYQQGLSVNQIIANAYPYTLKLALSAIAIEIILGISAGTISAIKRYSFLDVFTTLVTSILVSMPVFWLGMLLQVFFGIQMKNWTGGTFYLPISGVGGLDNTFPGWVYYILPAITLASVSTAYTARIMRSQLLEVMSMDYIRTAVAKGLSSRAVLWKHAMKNALIPVVTFIGIDFGTMMSGAILTETVFNIPGIGKQIYIAIVQRDWPVVMGGVILIVIVVMVINLLVDISYAFLDPRIRLGGASAE